jgi:hypothetical protein
METTAPEYTLPDHETSDLASVLLEKKTSIEQSTKGALDNIFAQVTEQDTLYLAEVQGASVNQQMLEEALAVQDPRERYLGKEHTLWSDEIDYVTYDAGTA